MYREFFKFKERPFQLVPNPAYIYLSRSHEEALAHLSYATSQGDGFVEMTGEVGTGKTTLCRLFLENLDDNIEVAYIFNPKLDSLELLKTINDEFEIDSQSNNLKDLIDALNNFIIDKRAEGKKVLLLIDEAQNLTKEVLEQLRLLSNLETSTDKLIQIILVGQPELGEKLDAHELRQLAQRITIRYHITPMTYYETREYIKHRLHVASVELTAKFTPGALKKIYAYSGGTPRLVNIACDRALLNAYVNGKTKITAGIATAAIRELSVRTSSSGIFGKYLSTAVMSLAVCAIVILGSIWYLSNTNTEMITKAPNEIATPKKVVGKKPASSGTAAAAKVVSKKISQKQNLNTIPRKDLNFGDFLLLYSKDTTRDMAMKTLVTIWDTIPEITPSLRIIEDNYEFFKLAAKQNGLEIYRINQNFNDILKLNLPAILEVYPRGSLEPVYCILSQIKGDTFTFIASTEKQAVSVKAQDAKYYWSGTAYVFWKNYHSIDGIVPVNAPKDSITALKMLIHDIGYNHLRINSKYDSATVKAVKDIQAKYGLLTDGVVGPLTKIVLYNESKSLKVPHLLPKDMQFGQDLSGKTRDKAISQGASKRP